MSAALVGHEKARATDHGLCPPVEAGRDVGSVGDAPGREDRIVVGDRPADSSEQLDRGHRPANVATRLESLGDHPVGPCTTGRECLMDGATLVDPGLRGPALRGTPEGDDQIGLRSRLEVGTTSEGQQVSTASGLSLSLRAAAISERKSCGASRPIVPRPPLAEQTAARRNWWPARPPPIPA